MSSDLTHQLSEGAGLSAEPADEARTPLVVSAKETDRDRYPDLDSIQSVTLHNGPRAKKEAKYIVIVDRHTGEIHHHALNIKTHKKKQGQWGEDSKHSMTLTDEGEDEIQRLSDFLLAAHSGAIPKSTSEYIVVTAPAQGTDGKALQRLLTDLSATGKADVLADILQFARQDAGLLQVLVERVARDPQLFADAAAALNLATYMSTVERLKGLINSSDRVKEATFQELLTENPWMFGSEYSELLDRRRWTRDEQQDFVVRRTTDNYIELIEIKTPLEGAALFNYDASHKSFYPGVELSKVLGQVQNYIEKLDADRNAILANDGEDTCKIRAKIIIGRDGDKYQRQALRRLNGHLHRIEVLTFDQLLRIAQGVLSYLQGVVRLGD